ncbi:MAG: hypothetical protein ACRD1S_02095 [Vicinamibacterales bacterium]
MSLEPLLFLLLVGAGFLSAVGMVGWWVFMVRAAGRAAARTAGRASFGGLTDVDQLFAQAARQIAAYSSLPANQRPGQSGQIAAMLGRMDSRMRNMDHLDHKGYDLRASQLSSMAAEAGIDWRAPSY